MQIYVDIKCKRTAGFDPKPSEEMYRVHSAWNRYRTEADVELPGKSAVRLCSM